MKSVRSTKSASFVSAKHNPFVVQRTAALDFDFQNASVGSKPELLKRFESRYSVSAILGRRGSGKTTLLKELQQDFRNRDQDSEFILIPREKELQQAMIDKTVDASQNRRIVLVDGIERLSSWQRQSMIIKCRTGPGFIATLHRRGLCWLPVLIHCKTSPVLLRNLLQKLDLDRPEIVSAALPLWSQKRGNIRLVMRELYDQYSAGNFASF